MTWLPTDFAAPRRVAVSDDGTHLRRVHPDDTDLDIVAVMGSHQRLWTIYGRAWVWPPAAMTADAEIPWWVVDDLVGTRAEHDLGEFVRRWIADRWPFARPRYIGIDLSWDAWLALPELG